MKTIWGIVAALAVSMATAAHAADMTLPRGVSVDYAPTVNWTGAYAGIHGGGFNGDVDLKATGTPDQKLNGAHYGVQAGYLYQLPAGIVIGGELDASYGDLSDKVKDGNYITQDSEVQAFGTARLRAGYALGRVLPYVTGGLAWQAGETGERCPAGVPFGHCAVTGAYHESDEFFEFGWVAGAGVEVMLTDAVTLRGEWLHMDFGSEKHQLGPDASDREISRDADLLRAAVNYRF